MENEPKILHILFLLTAEFFKPSSMGRPQRICLLCLLLQNINSRRKMQENPTLEVIPNLTKKRKKKSFAFTFKTSRSEPSGKPRVLWIKSSLFQGHTAKRNNSLPLQISDLPFN